MSVRHPFEDTDLTFALQWEEAPAEVVHTVLLREVFPVAARLAADVLGSSERGDTAVLKGLAAASAARAEFAGQSDARTWVLRFIEPAVVAAGRRWGLTAEAVRARFADPDRYAQAPETPDDARIADLLGRLAALADRRSPGPRRRLAEAAWIAGLAAVVLLAVFRFARSPAGGAGEGLFPTPGQPTPTAIRGTRAAQDEAVGSEPAGLTFPSGSGDVFDLNMIGLPFSPFESQTRDAANLGLVNAIAISHDGKFAATRAYQEVLIWSFPVAAYSYALRIDSLAAPIRFAHTSNLLATAGAADGLVNLWSIDHSRAELRFSLQGPDEPVSALAFAPDDRYLYAGTSAGVWIWELTGSGKAVLIETIRFRDLTALAVSPDGSAIALGGLDGVVDIRQTRDGTLLHRLGGHPPWITSLAYSPDGSRLIVGAYDQTILVWNITAAGAGVESSLRNRAGGVQSMAVSPDGRFLAVSSRSAIVVGDLWAPGDLAPAFALEHNSAGSLAFTPDGKSLAMAGRDGLVYMFRNRSDEAAVAGGTSGPPAASADFAFFRPRSYDAFPSQQVLLIEDGEALDPTTPLASLYSLSTREFSSRTGVYTPIPENLPEEAVFLGQRNTSSEIVSVIYELPLHPSQAAVLTIHLSTGVGGPVLRPEDFPDPWVGASAEVAAVGLGAARVPGELAIGGWVFTEEGAVGIPTDKAWVVVEGETRWERTPGRMILRWEWEGMLFEVAMAPVDGGVDWMTVEELLAAVGEMIDRLSG